MNTDACGSVKSVSKSVKIRGLHGVSERNVGLILGEVYVGFGVAFGILCEEMDDTVAVDRAREEVSLTILTAQHLQLLMLLFSLNPFGNDLHAEVSREGRDGANDRIIVVSRQ